METMKALAAPAMEPAAREEVIVKTMPEEAASGVRLSIRLGEPAA